MKNLVKQIVSSKKFRSSFFFPKGKTEISIVDLTKEECRVSVATGLRSPYEVEKNLTGKLIMKNICLQVLEDKYLLSRNAGIFYSDSYQVINNIDSENIF